ncbi:MAG: hypothetical protein ACRDV3_09200, partial [Acidothermaceae bacterium]
IGGVVAVNSGGGANSTTNTALAQAAAATSTAPSPSPSPSARPNKDGRRGPGGPGLGGLGGLGGPKGLGGPGGPGGLRLFGPGGKVLHGESTVATANGGTEIVDTQSGTISAVDAAAKTVTVTSTDKAAFSYVVDSKTRLVDFAATSPLKATLADLKVGDEVQVVAIRAGDIRTATSMVDGMPSPKARPTGTAGPNGQPWGWQGRPGQPAPSPSASPNASTASA